MFISSLNNDHLMGTINNGQRDRHTKDKEHEAKTASLPWPKAPPRKKRQYHYSRVPRRWLLSFPSGVKLLVHFATLILVFGFVALLPEDGV